MFRSMLLARAGSTGANDKRTCYELATQGGALDSRNEHHRLAQHACQVIDDLVLALKATDERSKSP
jgi:hypothetical protein